MKQKLKENEENIEVAEDFSEEFETDETVDNDETVNSVENPFIDAVSNDQWGKIKDSMEKTIADKINHKIEDRKTIILNKAIGK